MGQKGLLDEKHKIGFLQFFGYFSFLLCFCDVLRKKKKKRKKPKKAQNIDLLYF